MSAFKLGPRNVITNKTALFVAKAPNQTYCHAGFVHLLQEEYDELQAILDAGQLDKKEASDGASKSQVV